MLGQSVKLQPVAIQSLSELERARLQEVALYHLEERELDFKISIPKEIRKMRKSLRRKFDSFSKEKKEQETAPKAFGIPLSQVIANDRAYKQRQDALKESRRDCLELEASVMHFRAEKRQQNGNRPLLSRASNSSDASSSLLELQNKPLSPTFLDNRSRSHRRGGLSVDSISDLVESQSRLLEALQLSHPNELDIKKTPSGRTQTKLSLNPIYRQVPRVMERCYQHIYTYGLQTVGIFRVGSSKKRVRQLREDFDRGTDVVLDDEHSVHDVAALLKEFLRDMPDPLLPRELYCAFLHANNLRGADQLTYLQHLLYLLPPCNCDTLLRLLSLLHTVQDHAHDSVSADQQEISGNKMTAANLAVIFGPNLLQKERGSDKDMKPEAMGIEDSATIISVTLLLIQHYKYLFMDSVALFQHDNAPVHKGSELHDDTERYGWLVLKNSGFPHISISTVTLHNLVENISRRVEVSAELQQEVLMSLIQTDPDIIDYLLRRKLSVTVEPDLGQRRDTQASLDSVGQSSDDMSPIEPAAPLFGDTAGGSSLNREVFFNALRVNTKSKRPSDTPPKSIAKIRQFHSHHNLLSLAQPSTQVQSEARELQGSTGLSNPVEGLQFSHPLQEDISQPQSVKERSVWVRQGSNTSEDGKSPSNFWDFFTGKVSGSETVV